MSALYKQKKQMKLLPLVLHLRTYLPFAVHLLNEKVKNSSIPIVKLQFIIA